MSLSPARAPTPLSEPEMNTAATDPGQESGSGSDGEDERSATQALSRRRDRKCITEPSPKFLEFLREASQEDSAETSSGGEGGSGGGSVGRTASKEEPPATTMPSMRLAKAPSIRSLRNRLSGASPYKRRSNRQLRFKLDTSPLLVRQASRPVPSLKQRLTTGLIASLKFGMAGTFGFSTSWFILGGLLWATRGRRPRFRDNFAIDLDGDGRWSTYEMAACVVLHSSACLLALVLAKVALAVYYYAWLGWQAIRKNRRAAELQKTSPFFINRVSLVDQTMLDYLQSNYDFGPVTTLVPTSPMSCRSAEGASGSDQSPAERLRVASGQSAGSSRRKPSFATSAAPSCGERRQMRRRDTVKSVSDYMSLNNSEDPDDPPQGRANSKEGARSLQSSGESEMSPQPSFLDNSKLQELVCKLSDWNFDIFEVAELTPRVLSFIGFVCLDAYSKLVDFEKPKLLEFLRAVEGSYRKVPYHNSLHGASVTRSVYSFCAGCGLSFTQEYMEFTIVLAGLVHDVHHPGLTASFLSKASATGEWHSPITAPLEAADTELSLKYNDQSPLENMHCAIAFELLRNERTAFLATEEVAAMRKPLLRAILGTDMAKHAETMTRLAALIDNLTHDGESGLVPWHWPAKPPATADEAQREVWERLCQEEFVMELFLHAADIGNPTLPFNQWVRWNGLVQHEFHLQGDREILEFGELISPPAGFDRNAPIMAEHAFTKGFMQYLSLPLFQQLHDLTQVDSRRSVCQGVNISPCLENLRRNLELWEGHTPVRLADRPSASEEE